MIFAAGPRWPKCPYAVTKRGRRRRTRQIVQVSEHGAAHSAAHVLFTPGDARRARASDSGARRPPDLMTTQRYMHLSGDDRSCDRLLDPPKTALARGDILEAGKGVDNSTR